MTRADTQVFLFAAGCACMLASLFVMNVTWVGGNHRVILLQGLTFAAAADVCLVLACRRASFGWRAAAVAAAIPTAWVVLDVLRRW